LRIVPCLFYSLVPANQEEPCLLDTAFEDHHSPFLAFLPGKQPEMDPTKQLQPMELTLSSQEEPCLFLLKHIARWHQLVRSANKVVT